MSMNYFGYEYAPVTAETVKKYVPMQYMILEGLLNEYNLQWEDLARCSAYEEELPLDDDNAIEKIDNAFHQMKEEFNIKTRLHLYMEYESEVMNGEVLNDGCWAFALDSVFEKTPAAKKFEEENGFISPVGVVTFG